MPIGECVACSSPPPWPPRSCDLAPARSEDLPALPWLACSPRSLADALLHAITDALFGAAGLGDIGRHFPDTDPAFAGADSRMLLREAVRRVHKAGYAIGNVDATVIAQKPKLAPHVPGMVANLAEDLGIAPERCNVKAKTNEKLGFEGKEEGIVAQAVVLIYRAEGADQD